MSKRISVRSGRCLYCHSCEIACAREHNGPSRISVALKDGKKAVPVTCRQCKKAPCITICHTHAITRDERGVLIVDPKKCDGCKFCIMHCPFGVPVINPATHVAVICDLCSTRLKEGRKPACVSTCPAGALVYEMS